MAKLTKKQQQMLEAYQQSKCNTLHDCYGTFSRTKERVYERISKECWDYDGWGIKIPTYNSNVFTMAYCYVDKNACIHLVYHTPTYRHDFIVID